MTTRQQLVLVQGGRHDGGNIRPPHSLESAITRAIHAGFRIGRPVRIGRVDGNIVGYNIGHFGLFRGKDYPLLVRTRYGITKCSLTEVAAA